MWDTGPVDRSRAALVAADDSNRIIAVSEQALALLGYQSADQLLGHRLLALIPQRFHQAHLAGFSMYLTAGRRPLLDTEVTVPFLRCDGTEAPLRLKVEVVSAGGDHRVFVAHLARQLGHRKKVERGTASERREDRGGS
jgi:PAS domain S-box-containing protein